MTDPISAREALRRLQEGNARFVSAEGSRDISLEHMRRMELLANQAPFAIILGCSDSRVPAEMVFDQGLGESQSRLKRSLLFGLGQPLT